MNLEKFLGYKINVKLYKKKRYYYLHRLHVALTFVIPGLPLGLAVFLFPDVDLFLYLFAGYFLLFFLYLLYRRLTQAPGGEFDFLFSKRFYSITKQASLGLIFILIVILILKSELLESPFMIIFNLSFTSGMLTFLISILMLRIAFNDSS